MTLGPGWGNTGGSGFAGATPNPHHPASSPLSHQPNFPLIHVGGLRVSLSIATLDHRSWSLYHADLMSVEANPEGCDYHEGSAQPAVQHNEQASAARDT